MRKVFWIAISLLWSLACSNDAHAQFSSPVTARAIANVNAVVPGQEFKIGVLFHIPEPWHIYWKNPGDSGLATKIDATARDLTVGAVVWPTPVSFRQPGDLYGIGYRADALFEIPVMVPKNFGGTSATIDLQIHWLSCADLCVPGKASLEVTLPKATHHTPSPEAVLFEQNRLNIPPPLAEIGKVTLLPAESNNSETQLGFIFTHPSISAAETFVHGNARTKLSRPHTEIKDHTVAVHFNVSVLQSNEPLPTEIEAVTALTLANGVQTSGTLMVPLQ